MRPVIGIPCHAGMTSVANLPEKPIFYNNRTYVHAIERAGGVPIMIPILDELDGLQALLPHLDGLLLSGGIDVHPQYYREDPHPRLGDTNPQLDQLELALANWSLETDLPTLGICRGMQIINVALGGTLYQDITSQVPHSLKHPNWELPRNTLVHNVHIEPGSRMVEVLGGRDIPTNSLHHQAIKDTGHNIRITGRSEDGIAEMLEVTEHRFMLAAQCHPEELYTTQRPWALLFHAFIDACVENAQERHRNYQLEEVFTFELPARATA